MANGDAAIVIHPGASLHVVFDVTDDVGTPVALAGYHAAVQIRPRPGDPTLLLDATTENGMIAVQPGGVVGEVHLDVPATATALITRSGRYDCLAWNPSTPTEVLLIARGAVTIERPVTVL